MTAPLSVARLPPRRRRRLRLVVLVLLFALFLFLSSLVQLAAEWFWFSALGYERVFTTQLVAEALLGVGVGGLYSRSSTSTCGSPSAASSRTRWSSSSAPGPPPWT